MDAHHKVIQMKKLKAKTAAELLPFVALLLIASGCVHYKVIDADKAVRRLQANDTFKPTCNGWFVPDARWLEIREAIADKIETLEKPK